MPSEIVVVYVTGTSYVLTCVRVGLIKLQKNLRKKSHYNFAQGFHATISITTFQSKDLNSAVLLDRQLRYCHSNTINHGAAPRVLQHFH